MEERNKRTLQSAAGFFVASLLIYLIVTYSNPVMNFIAGLTENRKFVRHANSLLNANVRVGRPTDSFIALTALSGFSVEPYTTEIQQRYAHQYDLYLPFDNNCGKSQYINGVVQKIPPGVSRKMDSICTIDGDIIIPSPSDVLLHNLYTVLQSAPDAGIVAPEQIGDNRHLATVFQHHVPFPGFKLFYSSFHPSIAGGFWMFRADLLLKKDGGFDDVGSYGPEDVLFARYVMFECQMRCYLVTNVSVIHPPIK